MTYNTWGVASLVALNRSMVEDRELVTWGFGQVLPVIMLFSIVYAALDVYVGKLPFIFMSVVVLKNGSS